MPLIPRLLGAPSPQTFWSSSLPPSTSCCRWLCRTSAHLTWPPFSGYCACSGPSGLCVPSGCCALSGEHDRWPECGWVAGVIPIRGRSTWFVRDYRYIQLWLYTYYPTPHPPTSREGTAARFKIVDPRAAKARPQPPNCKKGIGIIFRCHFVVTIAAPRKYAFLLGGYLDCQSVAVNAQNDEFRDRFHSLSSRSLDVKTLPRKLNT